MSNVRRPDASDAFVVDLVDLLGAEPTVDSEAVGLLLLSEALTPLTPSPDLRARLIDGARAVQAEGRLARFATKVGEILDLGIDQAKALLARIDDPSAWSLELPGIAFLWVEGGPSVANAIRGFVRVDAGQDFPEHEHLGDEITLVLQGGWEDTSTGRLYLPGDVDHRPQGSSHTFRALPGGTDLLKLSVVQRGLHALGQDFLPR